MKKAIILLAFAMILFASTTNLYSEEEHVLNDAIVKLPAVRPQFFCGYCHILTYPRVIKKAHNSWKTGKHKDISCKECHYPPEEIDIKIPEHEKIPREEDVAAEKKTELEFMKTELEVLSRLISVLNMEESIVRTKPRIDDRSCTTSRCHPTTGKGKEGEYWTKKIEYAKYKREDETDGIVPYVHKTHFDSTKWIEGQELHCTSCHQRESGKKHFEVNRDKCFLCHFKNRALNETRAKCSLCHEVPTKPLQRQKKEGADADEKPVTHKSLEEAKVACESCHLHLFKGKGFVKMGNCLNCHDNEESIRKEIFNKKLMHERHVAIQNAHCFNCHEPMQHKATDFLNAGSQNCSLCHPEHHKYQKMLLLGKERKGVQETPGLMSSVNTNCLACHSEEKIVKGEEVLHGSGKACAACHTEKHKDMAKEWKDKTKEEMEGAIEVEKEALEAIKKADGKVSKKKLKQANEMVERGRENLNIVEYGGGVHNKKYSVMLLDEAMNNFEDAIDLLSEEE
jgi:hypothetical protein